MNKCGALLFSPTKNDRFGARGNGLTVCASVEPGGLSDAEKHSLVLDVANRVCLTALHWRLYAAVA